MATGRPRPRRNGNVVGVTSVATTGGLAAVTAAPPAGTGWRGRLHRRSSTDPAVGNQPLIAICLPAPKRKEREPEPFRRKGGGALGYSGGAQP